MMLENVNYGREELMVLNMVRQGLFGELLHGEAAYIHELRGQMNQVEHGTARGAPCTTRGATATCIDPRPGPDSAVHGHQPGGSL